MDLSRNLLNGSITWGNEHVSKMTPRIGSFWLEGTRNPNAETNQRLLNL